MVLNIISLELMMHIVVAVHVTVHAAAANQRDDANGRSPLECDTRSRESSSLAPGVF
jgi:hypothetical protein